ncbi:DUF2608 domain-containing protein [Chlamydia vaughanii]|uniref:DUF2608 domain-containing protein n=1 Tax=Chlamydia vaughanii TaxID=3112552 RepID=UPI0032B11A62
MKGIFFLTIFFSLFSLEASVIRVSDVEAVNKYARDGSLILLSLDSVVMFPKQMVGTEGWFYERLENLKKEAGHSDPLQTAVEEKIALTFTVDYELGHPNIAKVLAALSLSNAQVLGVSQMPIATANHLLRSASALGITFSSSPQLHNGWLPHPKTAGKPQHAMFIEDQVLFTGGYTNGITMDEAIITLFSQLEKRPKQIIYLDSNEERLSLVEHACKQARVSFIGMLYKPGVERHEAYNSDIANIQWQQLCQNVSNEYFQTLLSFVLGPEAQG